ncbi:MAG: aldo/keto reductase [Microthrixaceae bacterium]
MSDHTEPTRRLGRTELRVGPVAYGCWRFSGTDVTAAREKIETALECGMTLIDTADIYGFDGSSGFGDAEVLLGRVLAEAPELRERMVLATKGGIRKPVPYDQSATYLAEACEDSLRRLGVDHVDLYQVHRPDVLTHPADLAATLTSLVERGLTREVGLSNFTVAHTRAVMAYLDRPLATSQPQFSALHLEPLEDGTLDLCSEVDVTPLAWSPLAGGRLAGDPADERAARVTEVLDRLAGREGVDRSAVALAWVMRHPSGAVPIVGSQRPERIRAAAAALRVRLDRTDFYDVLVASRGERLP